MIRAGLANSPVLKQLGGAIVHSPAGVATALDPSIQFTDPRFGIDAALSAFDAQASLLGSFENRDRSLNNQFLGGGTRALQQDITQLTGEVRKLTASGSQFSLRHNWDYEASNAIGNLFPSAWSADFEAEVRHPLLRGGGVDFLRIAGPSRTPGVYNGVRVARIDADIAAVDFETALRDYVSNVENAYWDLYFAYRDLHAKLRARDAGLRTWRRVSAIAELRGGEAENEAQAREQYLRFELAAQNALVGKPADGTRTRNGLSGGAFRGGAGVLTAERRLRWLVGLPLNEGVLLRPAADPALTRFVFSWEEMGQEALARRVELRRQRQIVERRRLELLASTNHLLPQLDALGLYRFRGFGKDLLDTQRSPTPQGNAFGELTDGDNQEWLLGFELTMPVGFRRGHAGVRNAQLRFAREQAVLGEQEGAVMLELSGAHVELDRSYQGAATSFDRRLAAAKFAAVLESKVEQGLPVDL
ncbi:MAG: transporter, partial [Pirellulaceae bacterium]|nr:transporter [Pirellulaceae bacterium]